MISNSYKAPFGGIRSRQSHGFQLRKNLLALALAALTPAALAQDPTEIPGQGDIVIGGDVVDAYSITTYE